MEIKKKHTKGDRGDKVQVLKRAKALLSRDVPKSDGLVHRAREEKVVLFGRQFSGTTTILQQPSLTLDQLRSKTSAACP
jgi:hypothetical protein